MIANASWKLLEYAIKTGIIALMIVPVVVIGILAAFATAVSYAAMARKPAMVVAILAATPALAQQATPEVHAYQQTVGELTQAWIGARAALNAAQDQHIVDQAKIAALEAKLPRQEPVRGPSGDHEAPHEP